MVSRDTREYLGMGRYDWLYYPGGILAVIGFYMSDPLWAAVTYTASLPFLAVFLWKSFPYYLSSDEVKSSTRVLGLFGNVILTGVHVSLFVYGWLQV